MEEEVKNDGRGAYQDNNLVSQGAHLLQNSGAAMSAAADGALRADPLKSLALKTMESPNKHKS